MSNDKQSNVDEIVSAEKIRLIVTDRDDESTSLSESSSTTEKTVADKQSADVNSQSVQQSKQPIIDQQSSDQLRDAELPDAKKLIHDLPADEFFRVLERATPEQLQSIIHTFEKTTHTRGGAKLLNKIIEVPSEPRSLVSLVSWWEWRRPLYNLILALVGLPSIVFLTCIYGWPLQVTVLSALVYLFMANVCYTLGTPAELVARTIYKERAETYGPVLFTLGTIFSVLLTVVLELGVVGFMAMCMLFR